MSSLHTVAAMAALLLSLLTPIPAGAQPAPGAAPAAGASAQPRISRQNLPTTATAAAQASERPIVPKTIYNPLLSDRIWLGPFLYMAVVLGVYLYSPEQKRAVVQTRMKKDLNFFLASGVALSFLCVIAVTLNSTTRIPGTHWFSWVAWLAVVIAIVLAIKKSLMDPPPEEQYESPL